MTSAAPFAIERTADAGLATTVTAEGFSLARTYSGYGEVDGADFGAYGYELSRDAAGRIVRKTESSGEATHTWEYEYDTLGRLERATRDGQLAESYAYDAQGNRTAYRAPLRGIESTRAAYFDAEDRALGTGEATCTYTPDGFVASRETSVGTTTFDYTGLGELERATLPDGREITYRYDMSGRRVAKLVDGQVAERYEWADATRLLATYDSAGALTRRFLYADARTPYAFDTPAGRYFLAFDQTGSLRAVTDAAGAVVKRVEHDSFGNLLSDSNPDFEVPLGFAGGLADTDTGLTLFGARDYDPVSGRWMAKDPIGFAGGDVNLFGYCLADPVNLVDPAGLEVRVYSSPVLGLPGGANHASLYSTKTGLSKGMKGSQHGPLSYSPGGTGLGNVDLAATPYAVVSLPNGVAEAQFMRSIEDYPGWDNGTWHAWKNDCHTQMEAAFQYASKQLGTEVVYPGAPDGRVDWLNREQEEAAGAVIGRLPFILASGPVPGTLFAVPWP